MAFDDAFREFLHQVVVIEPWVGQNDYGESQYGPESVHRARVVGRQRMMRTMRGEEIVSTKTVYLAGKATVTVQDRITLPDGSSPLILGVADFPDEEGDHHTVVYTV